MATTTQAACAKVLATTELLEAILLEVDDDDNYKTLILAERVSSTFRACIQNSPRLQQRLFLKPLDTLDTPQQEIEVNPFLYHGYLNVSYRYGPNTNPNTHDPTPYHQITFSTDQLNDLRKALRDDAASSRLNMYLIRPTSEPLIINIAGRVSGWWMDEWRACVKVKQRVFPELIALATSLQAMVERRWQDHMRNKSRSERLGGYTRLPELRLEVYFTAKQREMMLSEPEIGFKT